MKYKTVYLIGTGPMAIEYYKVLNEFKIKPIVIGRGEDSANKFKLMTGVEPIVGGFETYILNNKILDESYIIIATGVETLMNILLKLTGYSNIKILVEKPAAISHQELLENKNQIKLIESITWVAYNRRYLNSVILAKQNIDNDGGLQNVHFDFTEWSHKIDQLNKPDGVKQNWLFANSSHVIDLASYFLGRIKEIKTFNSEGQLKWHKYSQFVGSGISEQGTLFSYNSNWESSSRWGITLYTIKHKFILSPLEDLRVQKRGEIVNKVIYSQKESKDKFKPGLYKMVEAFITDVDLKIPTLKEHIDFTKSYIMPIIR